MFSPLRVVACDQEKDEGAMARCNYEQIDDLITHGLLANAALHAPLVLQPSYVARLAK